MFFRSSLPLLSASLLFALGCSSSNGGLGNPVGSLGGSGNLGGANTSGTLAVGGLATGGSAMGGGGASGLGIGGQTSSGGATGGNATGGAAPAGGNGTGGALALGGSGKGGSLPTGGNTTGTAPASGGTGTGGTLRTGGAGTGGALQTGGSDSGGAANGGATAGGTRTTGGSANNTGGTNTSSSAGSGTTAGTTAAGGGSTLVAGACKLGAGTQTGSGQTEEQYLGVDVQRDGVNYRMITNGWGKGWLSHDISWLGTSLNVADYQGSRQSNGAPAGYPSVFCGKYSDTSKACGLPRALTDITALNTVVGWSHPDGNGTYNVAYDVWLGDPNAAMRGLQSYFMVWLHDPPVEGPAGSLTTSAVKVANVEGVWNIVTGTVNGFPIVNYVRAEGDDAHQLAFNIMDFIRDAQQKNLQMPGSAVLAVAIGFEIWQGPVTNLKLEDFCLDVQ